MKPTRSLAAIFLVLTLGAVAEADVHGSIKVGKKTSVSEWVNLVKISATDAVEIALKSAPGMVINLELGVDDGALVYEVAIFTEQNRWIELEIDAGTGKILERESDD